MSAYGSDTAEKLVREVEAEMENQEKLDTLVPYKEQLIIKLLLAIWYDLRP